MLDETGIASKIGPELRPLSRRQYQAIIRAARQVFLERGFSGTSVDMIAETARVSKRTVYRHFDDKYSLFAAVIQMLCESVVPASVEDLEVDTSDPREALIELGVHFLERIYTSEQIELYRIVVAEAKRFPEIGKMMYKRIRSQRDIAAQYLESLEKQNILRRLPNGDNAARYFSLLKEDSQMSLLFGKRKRFRRDEIREMAEGAVDIFLNGLISRD